MTRLLGSVFIILSLLTGCKPDPRGQVEVLGKTYLNKMGTEFYFSDKENVKATNVTSGVVSELKYTLAGDDLTVTLDPSHTLKFRRNGNNFYDSGNRFEIAEKTDADKVLIAKLQEEGQKKKDEIKRLDPAGSPSTPSSYVSTQSISDENNDWATWIAMAWNADAQNPETRLGVLSKKWYSNNDSFARQEIKVNELARIDDKLKQVRKIEYLAIKSGESPSVNDYKVFLDDSSGYDFDKKAFKLLSDFCNSGTSYSARSGAMVSFAKNEASPFCYLPVPDQAMAKQLETMRVNHQALRFDVIVYAKIAGVDSSNRILLVPVAIDYTVSKQTYKPAKPEDFLLNVSQWPKK